MTSKCTLSFDLDNLNLTADQVLKKNVFARVQPDPLKRIFEDLIDPARKIVLSKSLLELHSDVNKNIMYFCEGTAGAGVIFYLEIVTPDNRNLNAPNLISEDKGDAYLYKETLEIDSEDKAGLTFRVAYLVYLRDTSASISPDRLRRE